MNILSIPLIVILVSEETDQVAQYQVRLVSYIVHPLTLTIQESTRPQNSRPGPRMPTVGGKEQRHKVSKH